MKEIHVTAGQVPPLALLLKDIWNYRGLVTAFAGRDIKAKYTQTVLGLGWVLFSPLITVGVFTFVFGMMVKIPSDGLPYLLFYLSAIIPWYAFVAVLNNTVSSIESNAGLISKIYFPRLLIGASYAVSAAVDFAIGFLLVIGFAAYFGYLTVTLLLITPLLLLLQMLFALGLGFALAPLNTRYRDVRHFVPLAVQLYYFATPIIYPVSVAPEWARPFFEVNPLAGVINAYRQAMLGTGISWQSLAIAAAISLGAFVFGASYFLRKEQDLVDVL
jgi:lipopolysaccharide transport system permease protein